MGALAVEEHSLAELLLMKQFDQQGLSKHRGLYFAIRSAIQEGLLPPGRKLPSSRALAQDLTLSRNTVTNAFDQLMADGFLETRQGTGTYIAADLPAALLTSLQQHDDDDAQPPTLSRRGQRLCDIGRLTPDFAGLLFTPGPPDTQNFPYTLWSRIYNKHSKQEEVQLADLGAGGGYGPLRQAIADYVRGARAISCTPEQVFITSGTYQSLHLIIQLMRNPGDDAWIEDPGYQVAQGAFAAAELNSHPVPVDYQGLSLDDGLRLAPRPKICFLRHPISSLRATA